jgi:hypothetical protein
MQNAVTCVYRLSDGAPFEMREVSGERQIHVGEPMSDPKSTVIVVEIGGQTVRR